MTLRFLGYVLILFFWEILSLNSANAQPDQLLRLSIADTNRSGNIVLHDLDGWQFSFSDPEEIKDQKNLSNTISASINDIQPLKEHSNWNNYGWFELEFYADSTLGGIPWVLTYGNPEPARIWVNGRLIIQAGNPSSSSHNEKLSLFYNSFYEGITLRAGLNHILIEYSEHTIPRYFKPYVQSEHGIWLVLYAENGPQLRRYRAFVFGGVCMLLLLLISMHSFLAWKFRDQYHKYVSFTTLFMLVHAITTMSDSLFDWSYSYVYFYQYSYAISYIFVVYFFLISIRKIFDLPIPWWSLTAILVFSVLSAATAISLYPAYLNVLHPALVLLTLGYGVYTLYEARSFDAFAKIGIIATGLITTVGGAFLYVLFYVAFGYSNIGLFLSAVLMAYIGIPVSLTFNVASNYADLITTLEKKVKDRTADLETANEFQNRFFANISHEFRTPLTIIEGLLSKSIKKNTNISAELRNDFIVMKRNMNRLHDMVDQIIDLTKADKDHLTLHKKNYLADILVSISVESFRSLAEYHGHTFSFYPDAADVILHVDRAQVEVMLNNLISNAIKFTPDGGEVLIRTGVKEHSFYVTVQDSGPGIPESEKESIFERFHRIKRADDEYVEGMGVGLELSRKLAQLHDGDLRLDTSFLDGAKFMLVLPVSNNNEQEVERIEDTLDSDLIYVAQRERVFDRQQEYNLLFVEDNIDMIDYVSGILSGVGSLKLAKNGQEALVFLKDYTPDIIITDLMMPVMGGIELVEQLMQHPLWREIPVIVLTAMALDEEKSHVLRYGVVDYVIKPFVPDHLVLKIQNLLSYYKRRKSVRVNMKATTDEVAIDFTNKVAEYITKNIRNNNLTVDKVANEFAQSRRSFYRNLQAETGMAPAEFIREVRLNTARAIVVSNKNIRLEELAAAVGYKSTSSFRRVYVERFGEHPLS